MNIIEDFLNSDEESLKAQEFIQIHNSQDIMNFLSKESFFNKIVRVLKSLF